jgi:hypothetical protein
MPLVRGLRNVLTRDLMDSQQAGAASPVYGTWEGAGLLTGC